MGIADEEHQRDPLLHIEPLSGRRGLRLCGEVDLSNFLAFSAALAATFRQDRDFHLDLARLRYMDVPAVGLLARTAATLAEGREFVLESPAPAIRTTLRVFGWDGLPALRLVPGQAAAEPAQRLDASPDASLDTQPVAGRRPA